MKNDLGHVHTLYMYLYIYLFVHLYIYKYMYIFISVETEGFITKLPVDVQVDYYKSSTMLFLYLDNFT
jgi:hypothetical protein